jgi:hypothetical protein
MKKILMFFIYLILSLSECIFCQKTPVINLVSAFENPEEIVLSDFVESVTYIPLATTYDCLVDKNPRVYVTKDYIVTITTYRCLVFRRKNGEFIREINHSGRGPQEYQSANGFFNEYNSTFYFTGWKGDLIKYSIDDVYIGKIYIPGFKDSFESPSFPMNYSFINDSIILCDFLISTGGEPNLLMIFNERGKVIKTIPNHNVLKTKQKFVLRTGEMSFYQFDRNLFFQSIYNDTVFQISVNDLGPYFILDRGKYRPPFEAKWWTYDKWLQFQFIFQPVYFENERIISFNFYSNRNRYFAVYNKVSKSIKVSGNNLGIRNDIDGLINITFESMNLEGELIGIIQAKELVNWKEKNPGKFNLMDSRFQRLNQIEEEDNPIIVIATYK